MKWEFIFLEWLGRATQIPGLNWLSYILLGFTYTCEIGLIWIILSLILLIYPKTRKVGLTLAFGLIIFCLLANNIISKSAFHRTRPIYISSELYGNAIDWMTPKNETVLKIFGLPKETSYSFMSGHATVCFFGATTLFCYKKRYGIIGYVFAVIVSFSRLYFGVHYPTDVIFGSLWGTIGGIVSFYLFYKFYDPLKEKITSKFKKNKTDDNKNE